MLLFIVVALDDDQIVVFVRGDHHVVYFASHAQEGQVVLGVQVPDETPRGDGQLGQPDGVFRRFITLTHGRPDDLRLVSLLHLGLLHNDEALNTLVLLDASNTILDFRLKMIQCLKCKLTNFSPPRTLILTDIVY